MKPNKVLDPPVIKVLQLLTGRQIDHTFPVEYRIRDDDSVTIKIIVGLAVDTSVRRLRGWSDAKIVKYVQDDGTRCLVENPNISIYVEKDAVVLSYRKKEKGIFDYHISNAAAFQKFKQEMWELAAICCTDIKHTAICYSNDGITIEVKTSSISKSKLCDIDHISPDVLKYKDKKYLIKCNRIVHTFSPSETVYE
jgi:hypothetical protein